MPYVREYSKRLIKLLVLVGGIFFGFGAVSVAVAQEAPDVLIRRVSQQVLGIAKTDKDIQSGNRKRILELVEEKIVPYVDFERATSMAAGHYWREATQAQQVRLTGEFRQLVTYTYSGALSQVKDQKLEFKPLRADPSAKEVEVRSEVVRTGGTPIELDYRLEKTPSGWKIYDINVLGAWLVETYQSTFSSEIGKSGIDGLIKALAEKNKNLSSKGEKAAK